jgi:hypothetical protein
MRVKLSKHLLFDGVFYRAGKWDEEQLPDSVRDDRTLVKRLVEEPEEEAAGVDLGPVKKILVHKKKL